MLNAGRSDRGDGYVVIQFVQMAGAEGTFVSKYALLKRVSWQVYNPAEQRLSNFLLCPSTGARNGNQFQKYLCKVLEVVLLIRIVGGHGTEGEYRNENIHSLQHNWRVEAGP